jgi:hydroxymethylglutaryl-CoA synthase
MGIDEIFTNRMNTMTVGIDALRFYVPGHYLDMRLLAAARDVAYAKYSDGLGQEMMAVTAPDEDVITMAAAAGKAALVGQDLDTFDMIILATESGVDESKSGAIWVHRLIGLPASCQAFEMKQACCSGTAALQLALGYVRTQASRRVLIVAADVALYDRGEAGEPTQGGGAVAMVVSAEPRVLAISGPVGAYTEDVMDFWRPAHRRTALVDGKLSIRMYKKALSEAYADYRSKGGEPCERLARHCYHLPFTRMAEKAHAHLTGSLGEADLVRLQPTMAYNRLIGNSYTASLYISLVSLLENDEADLGGERIGLYAYGSGCMGLYLSGCVVPGYQTALAAAAHRRMLLDRVAIDMDTYERWHGFQLPTDGGECEMPACATGPYRLAGVNGDVRRYDQRADVQAVGLATA